MKRIVAFIIGIVIVLAVVGCGNVPQEVQDKRNYPSDEEMMSFLNDDKIVKIQALLGSGFDTQTISIFVGESQKVDVKSDDFIKLSAYGSKKAIEITNKLQDEYGKDIEIVVYVNNAIAYVNGRMDESKFTDNVIQ